jgi:hypothetical protein
MRPHTLSAVTALLALTGLLLALACLDRCDRAPGPAAEEVSRVLPAPAGDPRSRAKDLLTDRLKEFAAARFGDGVRPVGNGRLGDLIRHARMLPDLTPGQWAALGDGDVKDALTRSRVLIRGDDPDAPRAKTKPDWWVGGRFADRVLFRGD